MASVSASHLIIFIASIIVAASVAGVLTNTVGEISQAVDDLGLDLSQDIRTDIEIISDSAGGGIYDDTTDTITLYVKNTGSERLTADSAAMELFVNGAFKSQSAVAVSVVDGNAWLPGNVARVEIDHSLSTNQDVRVQLTINSDEEVFRFRT